MRDLDCGDGVVRVREPEALPSEITSNELHCATCLSTLSANSASSRQLSLHASFTAQLQFYRTEIRQCELAGGSVCIEDNINNFGQPQSPRANPPAATKAPRAPVGARSTRSCPRVVHVVFQNPPSARHLPVRANRREYTKTAYAPQCDLRCNYGAEKFMVKLSKENPPLMSLRRGATPSRTPTRRAHPEWPRPTIEGCSTLISFTNISEYSFSSTSFPKIVESLEAYNTCSKLILISNFKHMVCRVYTCIYICAIDNKRLIST